MTLSDISRPIDSDLKAFRKFFREALRSKNLLLDTAIRYILKRKGKQVRPLLVLLSASAAGGVSRRSYVGATMVELLHTATLVHDDVVDEAEERRGMPSVNSVWNNKTAVLVGDFMLAQGLRIANENNEYGFLDVTSKAVQRMSEGELRQTNKTRKLDIGEKEYFAIISDKTASLISACCEIGGMSASNDPAVRQALSEFGELVGIAFQIRDDIFDYTSTDSAIGKPTGNDLQEKKLTLPLIYALNKAQRKEAKGIIKLIRNDKDLNDERISRIREFVRAGGGIEYAERTAEEYRDRARGVIGSLPDSAAKDSLLAFADFVIEREA